MIDEPDPVAGGAGEPAEDDQAAAEAEAAVRALWPALHDPKPRRPGASLPAREVDLEPFIRARVPGPPGPTWAGRYKNFGRHFRSLEPEFAGRSRIAHLLACTIVVLRRHPENPVSMSLFRRITNERGETAAAAMNLRWLTSVCDTFCDIGNPRDRALALTGTMVANLVKLTETERRLFAAPRAWPPEAAFVSGGPLFDGLICYWVGKGDMIANLLERAEKVLALRSDAAPFVREVLGRCIEHDTVLRRMIEVNDHRTFPVAPRERLDAAREAMRGL